MKNKKYKLIILVVAIVFGFLSFGKNVLAAEYHVSPTGNAIWSECVDITSACSLETARINAIHGDVVNLRGGIYAMRSVPGDTNWQIAFLPVNNGTAESPIIFQAYDGETVFFDNSINAGKAYPVASYGANFVDYIIFDGIDTECAVAHGLGGDGYCKGVLLHNCTGVTVKNADIAGAGATQSGNNHAIRIEHASYHEIFNNILHDSNTTGDMNNTCITSYESQYGNVYNNTVYNCTQGLYDKTGGEYTEYHNNFIYSTERAIGVAKASGGPAPHDIKIYQNILLSSSDVGIDIRGSEAPHDCAIYNNSFYNEINNSAGILFFGTNEYYNFEIYNNIIAGSATDIYSPTGHTSYLGENTTIENYLTPGGQYPMDYKRTSYPIDGRGGVYPAVMGAYLTGEEIIGHNGESDVLVPSAPANLCVL